MSNHLIKSSLIAFCFFSPLIAEASSFQVSITDTLKGQAGLLAFDFLQGSPALGNSVTISNFQTDGMLGSATLSGSETGSLVPGPAVMTDASFFNELLQSVAYGTKISFNLTLTDLTSNGGIPDEFSFFLLNSARDPYATSDPSGSDSLFYIDLNGLGNTTPTIFTSAFATATVTPQVTNAPEPAAWPLCLIGMALLVGVIERALWRSR